MSQFLKFLFASCLGTLLAIGGSISILFLVGLSSSPSTEISSNSVLEIDLSNIVPELTDNIEQSGFGFNSESTALGVHDIVKLIRAAESDSKIKGLILRTEAPQVNPTTAYYISQVINEFAANSDKFVHAYGNYFSQTGYIIAASADSIMLNPNGLVDIRGYGSVIPYFKNFSEKTGVNFDVYHAGKFKSAIEPYYLDKVSDANRIQTQSYLNGYQQQLAQVISTQRDISIGQAHDIITKGLAENSNKAKALNLVDALTYFEDYEEGLEILLDDSTPNFLSLQEYYSSNPLTYVSSKNRIAIVYAEGTVTGNGDNKGEINMGVYEDVFEKIEKSKKIKAVILRVNSGGGSAFTSDVFLDRIKDLQTQGKMVVASFGNYAASGGYYIAASADHIIAEPTTLTGSIGVFSMMPNFNEFFADNLGVNWDTIGTGEHTFMYSSMVQKSPQDNRKLKAETERIYKEFKQIVADGRNMTPEEVEDIAQGRVWTGLQGLENGLVDQIGNLDDAIAYTSEKLELEDYKISTYPAITKTFWEELIAGFASGANAQLNTSQPEMATKLSQEVLNIINEVEAACEGPQARMPYSILIE